MTTTAQKLDLAIASLEECRQAATLLLQAIAQCENHVRERVLRVFDAIAPAELTGFAARANEALRICRTEPEPSLARTIDFGVDELLSAEEISSESLRAFAAAVAAAAMEVRA